MSDTVKVRTTRMHFGDKGHKVEGDEYMTDKAHAAQLVNMRLVEIIGETKAEQAPANKAEQVPENKGGDATTETPPVVTPAPETDTTAKPKARARRAPKAK